MLEGKRKQRSHKMIFSNKTFLVETDLEMIPDLRYCKVLVFK